MTQTIVQIPADSCCSHCRKEVVLSEAERAAGHFLCPGCSLPSVATLGTSARCGACNRYLSLDPSERELGRFRCPYCKSVTALPGKEATPGTPDALDLVVPPLRDHKRDIALGAASIGIGVAVTAASFFAGGSTFILAWGPVGFGLYRLIRGLSAKPPAR